MGKTSQAGRWTVLCAVSVVALLAAPPGIGADVGKENRVQADVPSGLELERRAARALTRLDERLELGTHPDGTGSWTARLAAALDSRLHRPESSRAFAPHLVARLAHGLRRLGIERDLDPSGAVRGPDAARLRPSRERVELIRSVLETVRLLHGKLDRAEEPTGLEVTVASRAAPVNDDCAAASVIGDGTLSGSTFESTLDGTASCGSSDESPDVWYRYMAAETGLVTFHAYPGTAHYYDTVLSVHSGCPGTSGAVELACNDDFGGTLGSKVTMDLTAGDEVWLRVSGFAGSTGDFGLDVERTGVISGTVTNEETGASVDDATVKLYDGDGQLEEDTSTALDGTYAFGALGVGSYYVEATAADLITEVYDDVVCARYRRCTLSQDGTSIPVNGDVSSGIDFALTPAAAISGTVFDAADGEGFRAFVRLLSGTLDHLGSDQAQVDGSYEFRHLPPGKYHVRAGGSSYRTEYFDDVPCTNQSCDLDAVTVLVPTAGETTSGIDFTLDRLGDLTGRVSESGTGEPVADAAVVLHDGSLYGRSATRTGPTGIYRFERKEPGTYFVWTDTETHVNEAFDDVPCDGPCGYGLGTPVTIPLNTTTTGIDFSLIPNGTISGTVTDAVSGAPLSSVFVEVYDEEKNYVGGAETNVSGLYEVVLPSGEVFVQTDLSSYAGHRNEVWDDLPCAPAGCAPLLGDPVEVRPETAHSGVDFALDRWGTIEGTARTADEGAEVDGDARVYDQDGNQVSSGEVRNGSYRIDGLRPGFYYVKIVEEAYSPPYHQDELYDDVPCEPSCDLSTGAPLEVGLNQRIFGVDFLLAACPANTNEDVSGTLYLAVGIEEACERLTAGDGTTIASGADVTFKAGRSVALGDGFSIESGGSFRVVIEPAWTDD